MVVEVFYHDMNLRQFDTVDECINHTEYNEVKILFVTDCNLLSIPEPLPQNLERLICHSNRLTSLPILPNSLITLHCSHNNITHLPDVLPPNMESLIFGFNQITEIPENLPESLECLSCSGTMITKLPDIIPPNIKLLFCSDKPRLKTIPLSLTRINHYVIIYDSNNNYEHIPPQVRRWLLDNANRVEYDNGLTVYDDVQSVHNHNIQKCVRESIERITSQSFNVDKEIILSEILEDKMLIPQCKEAIVEYCKDNSVHSELNLTFEELLCYVWKTLTQNEHRDEIKVILNSAILDAQCKCFTGRISRLINCLNGFSNLVTIGITNEEQIGNIIILIKTKLEKNGTYTIENHQKMAKEELIERGYDKELVIEWVKYIE